MSSSFLFLSHIPSCGCTTVYLFSPQLMGICVVSKRDAFKAHGSSRSLNSLNYMLPMLPQSPSV